MSLAKKWLELIASDLEDFESFKRAGYHADPRTPGWVLRIDGKLNRAVFPDALKKDERLTPEMIGRILGQSYAYFGWILDCLRRNSAAFSDRFRRGLQDFFEEDYEESLDEEMRGQADFGFAFLFCRFGVVFLPVVSAVAALI